MSLQSVIVAGDGVRDEVGVAVRVNDAHARDARLATVDYGEVVVVLLALKLGQLELREPTGYAVSKWSQHESSTWLHQIKLQH